MLFTPLRDSVEPPRSPVIPWRLAVRAISWALPRRVEDLPCARSESTQNLCASQMSTVAREPLHSQRRRLDRHRCPATGSQEFRRRPCARPGAIALISSFAAARRAVIARIDRFHWSACITSSLVSHASRIRFVCSEDLLIVTLFLWLATLHVATASRGTRHSSGCDQKPRGIGAWALSRSILPDRTTSTQNAVHAGHNCLSKGRARFRRVSATSRDAVSFCRKRR